METLNMQPLNNVGPSSLYDAGMGRQPHNMFPDVNVGAFEQEQLKNSMVFEPAVNWQALSDAGLPNFPKTQTPGPSTTAPSTFDQDFGALVRTVDPTDLWSDTSAAAGDVSNGTPPASSETSQGRIPTESTSPTSPSKASTPPSTGPSTRSTRARNAANRRHSKAKVARKDSHHDDEGSAEAGSASPSAIDSKTQRLREKNKLAAAKCRSRQRKQVQTIESKCNHLSAANSELKRQVRDLAGELNGLRAFALQHQGCNCQVASYNLGQARRVAADLQAFGTTGVEVQQKQQLRRQSGLEA